MFDFNTLYRWCDIDGGGFVIANSIDEAREKLVKAYPDRSSFIIWLWVDDDYFNKDHPDVFDIYGG